MRPPWMPKRWWAAQRLIRFSGSSLPPCERGLMWCACTAALLQPGTWQECLSRARPPQQRDPGQAALERDPLHDGALGHSQLLLAVMAEAGETEKLPSAALLEQRRHVPEHLVPAGALLQMLLQLRVDAPRIDLFVGVWRFERLDRCQPGPLVVFILQVFLEGFEIVLGDEQNIIRALV